jgi:ankyrin repeat protein
VVAFLVKEQAEPHILSNIHDDDKESPLDVAVRWNHQNVVKYLLENVQWTEDEIKRAIKQDEINLELKRILKAYSKRRFNCFFNFCICA